MNRASISLGVFVLALSLPAPGPQGRCAAGLRVGNAAAQFAGSLSVPAWPEAGGLSASDLRWRCYLDTPPWLLSAGVEVGADGLIGRKVVGQGVAIFCQVDPDRFQADEKTYFRYTRWRATRAVAQVLANLGAGFPADRRIFHPTDLWTVNLDGAWQMRATVTLPPAGSDTTAHRDPGITPAAQALVGRNVPAEGWTAVTLPQMLPFFKENDGEAVFRKEIDIPADEAGKDRVLALGALADFDTTYFNGVEVGHTDNKTVNWRQTPRNYVVPATLVQAGKNVITVRLFNGSGDGGFVGNKTLAPGDQPGPQSSTGPRLLPMALSPKPEDAGSPGCYHPDYRTDFPMGDNPYRYYRW